MPAVIHFWVFFFLFLARIVFQSSFFSESRSFTRPLFCFFFRFDFFCFFFLFQIWIRFFPSHSRTMDANSEARRGRGGCVGGVPNYRNEILIEIIKRHLPQGLEAWREVALAYQRETNEPTLCRGEGLCDNWNKRLCNRMQKPTGKPGALTERIF